MKLKGRQALKYLGRICLSASVVVIFLSSAIFAQTKEKKPLDNPRFLRIGYSSDTFTGVDLKDARMALEVWTEQLVSEVGKKYVAKTLIFEDFPLMLKAIRADEVEMVILSTLDYLKVEGSVALEPAFVGVSGSDPREEYVFLVNESEGIRTLRQLKNKRLIIEAGGRGKIALMWLDTLLLKAGLPQAKDFFREIKEVNNPSRAILPVFFKQSDACIVVRSAFDTMVELNPQVSKEIKVLHRSPGFLFTITFFHRNIDKEMQQEIRKSASNLQNNARGRQILTLFHIDRVIEFQPSYLENILALLQEYDSLRKN